MATSDGQKTGGRQKGTPNKSTQEVRTILDRLNCNPIEGLARIANGELILCRVGLNTAGDDFTEMEVRPTFDQRQAAYKELAQYAYPKRKAIEVIEEKPTSQLDSLSREELQILVTFASMQLAHPELMDKIDAEVREEVERRAATERGATSNHEFDQYPRPQ